jgi:hypothetical protein
MKIGLMPASVKPRKNLCAYNPRKLVQAGVRIKVVPQTMMAREATRSIGNLWARKVTG